MDRERFCENAAAWDAIVTAAPRPSPFLLASWLGAFWLGNDTRVVLVRSAGLLVGGAAINVRRRAGTLVGVIGLDAPVADVLAAPGHEELVAAAVIDALGEIGVAALDVRSTTNAGAAASWVASRRFATMAELITAPTWDLPDGFEGAYAARVSRKTRSGHQRRFRQLERAGPTEWALHASPDAVGAALPDAFRLHALRWAGRRDGSAFGRLAERQRHLDALRSVAAGGYVRLLELRHRGVPIAFHLYFLIDSVMIVYRLAFDPAFARFSPGLLTTLEAIRRASEEGARRVEFLRGDERYKLDLADGTDSFVRVTAAVKARGVLWMFTAAGLTRLRSQLRRSRRVRSAVRRARARLASIRASDRATPRQDEPRRSPRNDLDSPGRGGP